MTQTNGENPWDETTTGEVPNPGPYPVRDGNHASVSAKIDAMRPVVQQWQQVMAEQVFTFAGTVDSAIVKGHIVGWCISRPAAWDQTPYLEVSGGQTVRFRFNPADVMGRRLEGAALQELLEKGVIAIIEHDTPHGKRPYHLVCSHQVNAR